MENANCGQKITTVCFDLGGVLLRLRPAEYMEELGLSTAARRFFDEEILLREDWSRLDAGELTQAEAIEKWCKKRPDLAAEIRLYMKDLTGLIEMYPDSERIVEDIKKRGYELYVLSNYPEEMFALHEKNSLPFLRQMDGLIISAREKKTKPNADFYELFLTRYGKKASECVFIDDRQDNVQAARALGFRGICATPREKGFAELFALLDAQEAGDTSKL